MGGGLQYFSVSPRLLGFEFLGFGVWGLGLTITSDGIMTVSKFVPLTKLPYWALQTLEFGVSIKMQ